MTAPARLERTDRTLGLANLALTVCSVLVYIARRRLGGAAQLLRDGAEERMTLENEVARLRVQLDGALEHIHQGAALDTQGSPDAAPLDSQGSTAEPSALDSQGSEGGAALDIQGSAPGDQE